MRNWRPFAIILLIILIFGYVFGQLFTTSHKIQQSISKVNQAAATDKQAPHVVLIAQEVDNPYWRTVEKGARSAAKKYGVNLEYVGPIRINQKEQIEFIDKAIASKVDGILLQGSDDEEFLLAIQKAKQQGIPVFTVDTDSSVDKRKAYVGTDNYHSGQILGNLIARSIKGKGEIGIIIGSQSALNHELRLQGILSILKKYPEIKVQDIKTSNISQFQAAQQAEKMLKNDPGIQVIVGTSALDGVGIVQAVKGLNRNDVKVFGFDDLPETRKAIAAGSIEAVIVQEPYKMGFESIKLLNQFFKGEKIPQNTFTKIQVLDRTGIKAGDHQ